VCALIVCFRPLSRALPLLGRDPQMFTTHGKALDPATQLAELQAAGHTRSYVDVTQADGDTTRYDTELVF
jgi:hypothetical protein